MGRWPRLGDTSLLIPLMLLLGPSLVVGAGQVWRVRRTALAAAAAALLVVWLGYVFLGIAYFWWYLAAPLAGITLVASVGFTSIARGKALPIACVLFIASIWSLSYQLYVGRAQEENAAFGAVAAQLRRDAQPGERIFLEPIGMIGFAAPVEVIDEVGLVSPGVAQRRTQGPGWYTDVVVRERPDWLVVRAGLLTTGAAFAGRGAPFRSLAERDTLFADYREVWRGEKRSGDMALVLLRRTP
jgi:hypothetical protein